MQKHIFSAGSVLGSRAGSVGVGVSGCTGCAWVWRRGAAPSLALAIPAHGSARLCSRSVALVFSGVSVSVRVVRGRAFVRVRGARATLAAVAAWWSGCLRSAGVVR
jgi:hypothetical protein